MTEVCKYFLEGRCSFGNRCRNFHPTNQLSDRATRSEHHHHHHPQHESATGGLDDPGTVLTRFWDQLVWKGSPLWNRSQSEPTFKGLDMTMEEVRWEFYKHSQQEWPKLQQIIDNTIEVSRLEWLKTHGDASNRFLISASVQSQPLGHGGGSSPSQNPFGIFGKTSQQQNMVRSDGPAPQPLIATGATFIDPPIQQQSLENPIAQSQSFLLVQPLGVTPSQLSTSTLHPLPDGGPYKHLYPQAQELKERYVNELQEYDIWEIAAFLSSRFQDAHIPVKAPPHIPEFF